MLTEKDNTTQLRKSKEVSVTVEIYISGVVQGVGFRPMIYRNAKAHRLNGFVQNSGKGVTIKISGNQASVNGFIESLQKNIPLNASVEAVQINEIPFQSYPSFRIIDSNESSQTPGFKITPDFTLCANCRTELWDKHNRRCRYPFITCTDCGPRYSIIQMLPFDRAHTSMKTFVQCAECLAEYDDEADTRFHAQTNSCKNCGIRLSVYRNGIEQNNPTDEACLAMIQESLKAGETVAVKGIGGFLLMCDASNHKALKRLRERKHRPGKPFAVMFPNIQTIRKMLTISAQEENELLSVARPIVLLNKKEKARQCIVEMVAPGLDTIGAFLPCAPLLELIVQDFSLPLVATSANVSGSGIVYSNDDALKLLPDLCDLIVLHNRDIVIPQDDSVIRFTPEQKQRIVLRNGRGFAPVQFSIPNLRENIFAAGAMLKSTVALASDQKVLISQYIGNTSQYEVQQSYKLVAHHLMKLWHHVPDTWLCDMHPDYFSSNFVAENKNDGLKKSIQHHQAHFAAVLFENKLTDSYTPVLGVVWDGLGLGKDGQIWGGEFFTYKNGAMARACHFEYRPFILGDKMSREPRIAAFALSDSEQSSVRKILSKQFNETEYGLYSKMKNSATLQTSSCGRLFDAVAALTGICSVQSFEGEAAMLLEKAACGFKESHPLFNRAYDVQLLADTFSVKNLLNQISDDIIKGTSVGEVALKFHNTLVDIIGIVLEKEKIQSVAFSGGVFQNALLIDLMLGKLGKQYTLYFHKKLSPNDECISLGQIVYYTIENKNNHL